MSWEPEPECPDDFDSEQTVKSGQAPALGPIDAPVVVKPIPSLRFLTSQLFK